MEVMHLQKRWSKWSRVRKVAPGFCTKSRSQHHGGRGVQILDKEKEDVRFLDRREAKSKEGQYTGNAMRKCRTRRINHGGMRC